MSMSLTVTLIDIADNLLISQQPPSVHCNERWFGQQYLIIEYGGKEIISPDKLKASIYYYKITIIKLKQQEM